MLKMATAKRSASTASRADRLLVPVKHWQVGVLVLLLAVCCKLTSDLAATRAELAAARAPDAARRLAMDAFNAAEDWRQTRVLELYANMTEADWDSALRWKSYAQPDAPDRTCAAGSGAQPFVRDIALLLRAVAALPHPSCSSTSRCTLSTALGWRATL